MGGTLTKERPGLRWCQYPPARQALVVPSGVSGSGVVVVEHRWWGWGACRAHCWVLRSPATGWWGAWYGPVLGPRTAVLGPPSWRGGGGRRVWWGSGSLVV